jgi:hypothetical protein
MSVSVSLKYLFGYPEHLVSQVRELLDERRLGPLLLKSTRRPTGCATTRPCTST